jgi:hypothetical protein
MDSSLLQIPTIVPPSHLTDSDFNLAASFLKCEPAIIKGLTDVEAPQGPFQQNGTPTILFERHVFHRLTGGRFDSTAPDISNAVAGGYGKYSEQWARLQRAAALSFDQALMAASWGAFQIMGENFYSAGFSNVEDMVYGMRTGVSSHLLAFTKFIMASKSLTEAIQSKDWNSFALHYNGPGNVTSYSSKLAEAYSKYAQ